MVEERRTRSKMFSCIFKFICLRITFRIKNPKKEVYWCFHVALKCIDRWIWWTELCD